jgi:glycosyltransferase involved in cell wall biosynthesis
MTAPSQIAIPAGVIACTTYGQIRGETAQSLMEMRSHSEKQGLVNVQWAMIPGGLVEKARNDAVRMMLGTMQGHAQWLLQIDGDMTFAPDALVRILQTAYGTHPWVDVLGGYCTLRGEVGLPTIDTGTGTWEAVYPGRGVVEVMRTGTAFLLVKRHVFERMPQPWFRTRVPARPIDFMAEVDNWARIKMDGRNPFRDLPGRPWEKLEGLASVDPSSQPGAFVPAEVGEDSGFCDRAKNAGFRIAVQTDIEIGHLETRVTNWTALKKTLDGQASQWLQAVGVA